MTRTSHPHQFVWTICTIGSLIILTGQTSAAVINVESGMLQARGDHNYESGFGSGWGSSSSSSAFSILKNKLSGDGGAGAGYGYALDWNGFPGPNDTLQIFSPLSPPTHTFGYAVDSRGSSFSSESEIRNAGQPMSLRIEPGVGEANGTPVLVQIDMTLVGELSAYGVSGVAQASFWTASSAGPIVDETWTATNEAASFFIDESQVFESTIGEQFSLEFDHLLQASGEYDGEACGAFVDLWEFSLSATILPIPEPSSLVIIALGSLLALKRR